ncbi:MAG: helix-turn-helix transcriptional regulator [Treponema sp.]|nr:helix-turn-helix transcriptional regulator [Treponema sp.]
MSKIKTILGDNIRSLRTGKGWTQVYLADRLQITAPFLAQIEAGKRGMSLELIDSVAELFEIPVASLFIEHFPSKQIKRPEIRTIEIQTIKKQLQEAISENITKAFDRLK